MPEPPPLLAPHRPDAPDLRGSPYAHPLLAPPRHVGAHHAGCLLRALFTDWETPRHINAAPRVPWSELKRNTERHLFARRRISYTLLLPEESRTPATPGGGELRVMLFADLSALVLWNAAGTGAVPGSAIPDPATTEVHVLPVVLRLPGRVRFAASRRAAQLSTSRAGAWVGATLAVADPDGPRSTATLAALPLTPPDSPGPAAEALAGFRAQLFAEAAAWAARAATMPRLQVPPQIQENGSIPAARPAGGTDPASTAVPAWAAYSTVTAEALAACRDFLRELAAWSFTWAPAATRSVRLTLEGGHVTQAGFAPPIIGAMVDSHGLPGTRTGTLPGTARHLDRVAKRLVAAGRPPLDPGFLIDQLVHDAGATAGYERIARRKLGVVVVHRDDLPSTHGSLALRRRFDPFLEARSAPQKRKSRHA